MNPVLNWTGTSALPCLTGQECADWCTTQKVSVKQFPYLLSLIAFIFLMASNAQPENSKYDYLRKPLLWVSYAFIIAAIATDLFTA